MARQCMHCRTFKWHFRCSTSWIQIWEWNAYTPLSKQQQCIDWRDGASTTAMALCIWGLSLSWYSITKWWLFGNRWNHFGRATRMSDILECLLSFREGTRDLVRWNSLLLDFSPTTILGQVLTASCCVFLTLNTKYVKLQKTSFVLIYSKSLVLALIDWQSQNLFCWAASLDCSLKKWHKVVPLRTFPLHERFYRTFGS